MNNSSALPKNTNIEASAPWTILYERFEPAEESLREALCTLGNGYFGTRGAIPESVASKIHYPGTYIAGVYNRLITNIAGKRIINEDLVNCPNWIFLTFKVGDGEWFLPSTVRILSYNQKLDMRRGILSRKIRFQNRKGQRTSRSLPAPRILNHRFPVVSPGRIRSIAPVMSWCTRPISLA